MAARDSQLPRLVTETGPEPRSTSPWTAFVRGLRTVLRSAWDIDRHRRNAENLSDPAEDAVALRRSHQRRSIDGPSFLSRDDNSDYGSRSDVRGCLLT